MQHSNIEERLLICFAQPHSTPMQIIISPSSADAVCDFRRL